jgi:glycosyltransferase involved in cell wall biosynthesis
MPRVLVVLHEDTLGGASRALLHPLGSLRERGWEATFWCSVPSPLADELEAMGHHVEGAPRLMRYRLRSLRDPPGVRARLTSFPRSLAAFRRALRAQRPDLVHVNGRLALPEAMVARAAGLPVATYIHDDALPGVRGALGRVVPWIASRSVMGVSTAQAESLRLGRRRAAVVHPSPQVTEAERVERPAGATLVVGTIGVLSPRKGTDLFVDMAYRLRAAGVDCELRIAGGLEQSYLAEWGRAQVERGAGAGVRWLGQTDVARELREWDVAVAPSRADPFPLAVLEAMAAGVAVVGCAVEGIPEQLADGAGVLVAPGDPGALAEAVAGLLADPERRAAIAATGQRRVRAHFTLERTVAALENAWRAALGQAAR